jgi:hypothetical protein
LDLSRCLVGLRVDVAPDHVLPDARLGPRLRQRERPAGRSFVPCSIAPSAAISSWTTAGSGLFATAIASSLARPMSTAGPATAQ